ncbi:Response regulator MprA [Gemmata obscuriglobus]|uniref:Response regulator n=1 Tax=Gemmata obscuriglobus TaxID=114 RepID=A0A2Z3H0T8_9BACT|nr:response regulator [Gemmata obscuriglobus]AWM37942.1 response regulator [Gemmata obscuriglobus]QEG29201.1 Response regulator MprA [Gemmata obscuriglobus]VTS07979.1 multi-sensor hybrid histidine kinase : Multi-sensor hybrid histidine kinase OS=Burkholderia sp. RPE67 GN=BRPE67_CCDS07690 PE=4 SV=1: Response_reg [Gemmata obscuriglobus UQM 2246]
MLSEPFPLSALRGPTDFPLPVRLHVLVVDDNHDAADSTAELLAICGANVDVRYDGAAAVAAVQESVPEAIILDLTMPGLDGCDVARRIRQVAGPAVLLVALTALGDEYNRARTAAAGFNLHFTKPVDPSELLAVLGEHRKRIVSSPTH